MPANPNFEIALCLDVWKCNECEKFWTDEDDIHEPIYECGSCGNVFSRRETENGDHRCPSCNKFGSKVADESCPEGCSEEMESLIGLQPEGWDIYVPLGSVQEDG